MRKHATRIVRMRQLLIRAIVLHALGDEQGEQATLSHMNIVSSALPLQLQRDTELLRRVGEPVRRKLNREGILAQNVGGVQ